MIPGSDLNLYPALVVVWVPGPSTLFILILLHCTWHNILMMLITCLLCAEEVGQVHVTAKITDIGPVGNGLVLNIYLGALAWNGC